MPCILHRKINFLKKIRKLVINLQVFQRNPHIRRTWGKRGFSSEFNVEERRLNNYLSEELGITPKMTANPGGDADKILASVNTAHLMHFLDQNSDDYKNLSETLKHFDEAAKDFRFIPELNSKGEYEIEPPTVIDYKQKILKYHKKMYTSFPWAACSSCQHDLVDHAG